MKSFIKTRSVPLLGIMALVTITGFSMVACDDDNFDTMYKPNFYGTWVCPVGGQGASLATAKPYTIEISSDTFFITNANYNASDIGWKKIENMTWTSMENPSTNTEFETNTDFPEGYKIDGTITYGTNWGDESAFVALNKNGKLLFNISSSEGALGGIIICDKQK